VINIGENKFRKLDRAIGNQNEKQKQTIINRFEDSKEDMNAFHFGSHYSNPGVISYYLIRIQPFSRIAYNLQG
jgi:hypothetical protein